MSGFDFKSHFKYFLEDNLTMENSQEVYEVFYSLESGEEILFRNCCKILGIDRDKFLANFEGTEIFDVDEDCGLTAIAAAERFGKIEYENPDEPTYGTIKDLVLDNSNREYMKFRQKLYHAAARNIVSSFFESSCGPTRILHVVERIGAFRERNKRCLYESAEELLIRIRLEMYMHDIHNTLDESNEPSEDFSDRFIGFFNSLGKTKQSHLLSLLGIAKHLSQIAEKRL